MKAEIARTGIGKISLLRHVLDQTEWFCHSFLGGCEVLQNSNVLRTLDDATSEFIPDLSSMHLSDAISVKLFPFHMHCSYWLFKSEYK